MLSWTSWNKTDMNGARGKMDKQEERGGVRHLEGTAQQEGLQGVVGAPDQTGYFLQAPQAVLLPA